MSKIRLILLMLFTLDLFSSSSFSQGQLVEMSGKQIAFSGLKGNWVLINYWASWCQPCLDEINELNTFYKTKPNNVILYGVNFDAFSINKQKQLIKKLNIRYPNLAQDPSKELNLGYVQGVPATFVFTPAGKLKTILYGSQNATSLNKVIQN